MEKSAGFQFPKGWNLVWTILALAALAALGVALFLPSDQIVIKVRNVSGRPVAVTLICEQGSIARGVWLKPREEATMTLFAGESHGTVDSWTVRVVVMDEQGATIESRSAAAGDLISQTLEVGLPPTSRSSDE